jgi:hypothetical protein
VVERALEVAHRDPLVDGQPLDLVEDRAVRGVVRVGAEDPAGADDVDRRPAGQHGAGLDRRGVGAQHEVVLGRFGPERVLHGPRRVVGPEVEGVEVEPLGLEDRALGDLPAHGHEDVGDQLRASGDGVPGALGNPVGGQGDVDGLLDQDPLRLLLLEHRLPLDQRLLHRPPGVTDALAGLLAGRRRQGADLAVGQGQRRAVTGVLDPDLLERVEVGGGRYRGERGVARGLDLLGLQGSDLHGVEVGVRSGHRTSLGTGGPPPRTG